MEEAIAQDPEAALRAVPGSALRAPGSTGLALAAGAPTVTADELAHFLAANDGHVLENPARARLVLALGPERDELWRLDAGDDVADTAVLLPTADGGEMAVRFAPDGTVIAASEDGDGIGGRWWWSRGDLHVALDGASETSAYPWRAVAAREPGLLGADPDGLAADSAAE